MKFNEFPELTSLTGNEYFLVQETDSLALKKVKIEKLKQYIGVSSSSTGNIRSEILKDNPIGYWSLDETSGTAAANLGSGMSNGVYSGVTLAQSSLASGSAYSALFTNTNNTISFTNTILNNTTAVTIEVIVNLVSASVRGLFIQLGTNFEIGLGIGGGGDTNSNGNYLIGIAGNVAWRPTYKNIGIGTHHLVMIYQGATTREWLFYIDGFLVQTLGAATPNPPNNVGRIKGLDSGQLILDEVAIYNKSLSPNRILNHANTVLY